LAGAPKDALDTARGLCIDGPHRLDLNPDGLTSATTSRGTKRSIGPALSVHAHGDLHQAEVSIFGPQV
jgi:recombinational DNA repair ATPase RecF